MFQEFRTHAYSISVLFPIFGVMYMQDFFRCQCFLSKLCKDIIEITVSKQ